MDEWAPPNESPQAQAPGRRRIGRPVVIAVAVALGLVGLVTALVGDVIIDYLQPAAVSFAVDPDASGQSSDRPQAVMLDQLPSWGSEAEPDGEGPVEFEQAVTDLALFAAVVDDEGVSALAGMFELAGFVDGYYRRWLIHGPDRPMLIAIMVFEFRDVEDARVVHDTVGDLLSSPSLATFGDAWQTALTGGPANIFFVPEPFELPSIADVVILEAHVDDAEIEWARGLTYEKIAFQQDSLLATLTVVFTPDVDTDLGRDRTQEIAELQHARM